MSLSEFAATAAPTPTPRLATRALHSGVRDSQSNDHNAILTPIYQTATYVQTRVGDSPEHTYSRCSNPTVSALEARLAHVFEAEFAYAFKTGLAAITTLLLATLKAGDHVVCGAVVYGGTVRLLRDVLEPFGVKVTFVDATDLKAVRAAVVPATRLVFAETPANPTLAVCDLAGLQAIARAAGALFVVDNTFLTGVLQPVLSKVGGLDPNAQISADVEVLSTTKYVEGHDATTGGALLTNDADLAARLKLYRGALGTIQAPFDAWLTLRGLGTLPLRLKQHSASAETIAHALQAHPAVARVFYPFLDSNPDSLARRQQRAGGGMLAFELVGGTPAAHAFLGATRLCALAENLGAAETLLTHPATMTHSQIPPAERAALGITDGLVRLSVGLEDPADILLDLEQALQHATAAQSLVKSDAPGAPLDAFATTGQSGGQVAGGVQ
jgi:cystathionine beta-lyase/cystathionine gamma-synthase